MPTISVKEASDNLYKVIDETAETHVPVLIIGKRNNAVLVSESDWNSIQETLYMVSIPKMRESIREGMEKDVSDCSDKLDW